MRAATLTAVNQPLEILDISVDKPRANEVLITTAAAGVCHSDMHFQEGKYPCACPTVLGHEGAGGVEAVVCREVHLTIRASVVWVLAEVSLPTSSSSSSSMVPKAGLSSSDASLLLSYSACVMRYFAVSARGATCVRSRPRACSHFAVPNSVRTSARDVR